MPDWSLPDWFSVVGFPLGLFGLGIAIWELSRTRRVAVATKEAVERTAGQLVTHQVLGLLPRLQRLEDEIDVAVSNQAKEVVLRHLGEWRTIATEVHGLIKDQPYGEDERTEQLRLSATSAAAAKSQLVGSKRDLAPATKAAREEIAIAGEYAGTLAGRLKAYSGEAGATA